MAHKIVYPSCKLCLAASWQLFMLNTESYAFANTINQHQTAPGGAVVSDSSVFDRPIMLFISTSTESIQTDPSTSTMRDETSMRGNVNCKQPGQPLT